MPQLAGATDSSDLRLRSRLRLMPASRSRRVSPPPTTPPPPPVAAPAPGPALRFRQNHAASVPHSSSGLSVRIRHRREQPVLSHQAEHPVLADPDPLGRKPRLHLPVALAEERTRLQHRPDLFHPFLIAQCRLRAPLPRMATIGVQRPALLRSQRIHARPRDPTRLAHHRQRIPPVRRRTHPPTRLESFLSSSPNPPFFEKLRLQLDPHRHLPQLRPGAHQLPSRPVLLLQALPAAFQELPPPPLQLRRRYPNLPAHLADVLAAQQLQHHPGLPLGAPPLGEAGRPPPSGQPSPTLSYSETSCASSPFDPRWMAKVLSKKIGGTITTTRRFMAG